MLHVIKLKVLRSKSIVMSSVKDWVWIVNDQSNFEKFESWAWELEWWDGRDKMMWRNIGCAVEQKGATHPIELRNRFCGSNMNRDNHYAECWTSMNNCAHKWLIKSINEADVGILNQESYQFIAS